MDNPFLKRATEFLRDDDAFLAIVSPEPVHYFLAKPGKSGSLYDRLTTIQGTPGSGKTTLARLFTLPTLAVLLRNRHIDSYRSLIAGLTECGAVTEDAPAVAGCRLPLETDYRDFWEFDYPVELKLSLMTALVQARAMLAWLRNLAQVYPTAAVSIIPREDADAAVEAIGGTGTAGALARARAVEDALYGVVGALVPPPVQELDSRATSAYRPFDVIDRFKVSWADQGVERSLELRPLVILDDAHVLHPEQFLHLRRWLARRELRVARWVLTRLDVAQPGEVLEALSTERSEGPMLPGITADRDMTQLEIMLQSRPSERREQRVLFRRMAKDMSDRYLRRMPIFHQRGHQRFADLLSEDGEALSPSKLRDLHARNRITQKALGITDARAQALDAQVRAFRPEDPKLSEDVRLAMLHVLLHRYGIRTPQRSLFEADFDPEPTKPIVADAGVVDGARIHLFHQHEKPYYFGIDDLCDSSSENAEQFLHLAAILVDQATVHITRAKPATLSVREQHDLLRQRSAEILRGWAFPQHLHVRRLVDGIASLCLARTLEPNAPLSHGANALGVPQDEFAAISVRSPGFARVLQFAVAYNAVNLVPNYLCHEKSWCLLELGGVATLHYGLPLKRGGFIEGTVAQAAQMAGVKE